MRFETPLALLFLLLTPLFFEETWRNAILDKLGIKRVAPKADSIPFSPRADLDTLTPSSRLLFRTPTLSLCWSLAYIFLVLALARPQSGSYFVETLDSGRDIVLLLDVSGSMEAQDFYIDGKRTERLEALKKVVKDFVDARSGDRIGLVVFGTEVYTQCPLTLDHSMIKRYVDELSVGMAGERTALGDAIAIGLKRIRDIEAESKVLVLVTDGIRTAGRMNPLDAAEIAGQLQVKVYTVGIGGKKPAPFPRKNALGLNAFRYHDVPLDEETLQQIAANTGAHYFNATKMEELQKVYEQINQLEKRKDTSLQHVEYQELFLFLTISALLLLLIGELLETTVFLTAP